jgi:hypothetical protein
MTIALTTTIEIWNEFCRNHDLHETRHKSSVACLLLIIIIITIVIITIVRIIIRVIITIILRVMTITNIVRTATIVAMKWKANNNNEMKAEAEIYITDQQIWDSCWWLSDLFHAIEYCLILIPITVNEKETHHQSKCRNDWSDWDSKSYVISFDWFDTTSSILKWLIIKWIDKYLFK